MITPLRSVCLVAFMVATIACAPEPEVASPTTAATSTVSPASTEPPTTVGPEPTTTTTEDPNQALVVTREPIGLPEELLSAVDGLVLGGNESFLFPDGAEGGRSIVIRVEGGEANAVRGRWCGTFFGPPPLDDHRGGAVVPLDTLEVVHCLPGTEVSLLSHEGIPLDTALIDGRPFLAVTEFTNTETIVRLMALESSETVDLLTLDRTVELPLAASRSGDGVWVVTVEREDETLPGVRYVFVDDSGSPIEVSGNPQPEYPEQDSGFRQAAFSPDGETLVLVQLTHDGNADVLIWDLVAGAESSRHPVIAASPRESVSYLDVHEEAIVVNTSFAEAETHPYRVVRIDVSTGELIELSGRFGDLEINLASFLGD